MFCLPQEGPPGSHKYGSGEGRRKRGNQHTVSAREETGWWHKTALNDWPRPRGGPEIRRAMQWLGGEGFLEEAGSGHREPGRPSRGEAGQVHTGKASEWRLGKYLGGSLKNPFLSSREETQVERNVRRTDPFGWKVPEQSKDGNRARGHVALSGAPACKPLPGKCSYTSGSKRASERRVVCGL